MSSQPGKMDTIAATAQSAIPMTVIQPQMHQPQLHQQMQGNWMAAPTAVTPNCPPGLEYLTMIDQILVSQKTSMFEVFVNFEMENRYYITNTLGQLVYYASEDSDFCARYCCGPLRPFEMHISDNYQREVLHISRPFRMQNCFFPCFLQEIEVTASGQVMGYVKQDWSICVPKYTVYNASNEPILKIEGPCITCACCADVEFQILSRDGKQQVGMISKQWGGMAKEMFTDSDQFGVKFPLDLDVAAKATLLCATFLIDFMYFETNENNN